jgi:zinc transport system substrate-binding protein
MWWTTLLVTLIAGLAMTGCGSRGGGDGRLDVVASFYPLAEATERVGGDLVDVTNLTPAGQEPHDIELTPDQLDRLEDADLVVYLGGGFQPAVEAAVERSGAVRLDVGGAVRLEHADPHFWLDPTRLADAATAVERALADARPHDAGTIRTSAGEYRSELADLDATFERGLASCERNEIVTSHAAFHYLAERYGLDQLSVAGIVPEAEPHPNRLADLADLVDRRGITTIFRETLESADLADTLAREAGVDTAILDPIEALDGDAIDAGASYVTVMEDNLAALREALGCR